MLFVVLRPIAAQNLGSGRAVVDDDDNKDDSSVKSVPPSLQHSTSGNKDNSMEHVEPPESDFDGSCDDDNDDAGFTRTSSLNEDYDSD